MRKRNYIVIGLLALVLGLAVIALRAVSKPDIVTTDGNVPMAAATKMARVAKQEFRRQIISSVSLRDYKSLPYHWRRYFRTAKVFVGVHPIDSETTYKVVVWNDPRSYEYVTYQMKQEGKGWTIVSENGSPAMPVFNGGKR
ncbi:hypothetical protein [Pedosphaera parvula]|uniref:Uncharacterized protein n=1 Tax=Pedosphaera parvula (strain Ellin514) TaxID=320771 RepID=B9XA90_PEDPL|nr:hypothetical protein [Pedosphaera parvula]EEF63431.1 hypothetical protein Cflav_PD6066 [Pedosphaera parvula Ellin514]